MYVYRCAFFLTEHNNLKTVMFIRALDEDSAKEASVKVFKEQCVKYGIPDAKFAQQIRLSSDEEVSNYTSDVKKNTKLKTMVN